MMSKTYLQWLTSSNAKVENFTWVSPRPVRTQGKVTITFDHINSCHLIPMT